jgi:hypothetical protein
MKSSWETTNGDETPPAPIRPPGGARATCRPRNAARRGLTLAELVLSLAITSVVAGAVAFMLTSMRPAAESQTDVRNCAVSGARAAMRLDAAVRGSRMVLAQGAGYLVLWAAETTLNEAPDLSELRRIERDPATDELHYYEAPAGLTDDTQYDLLTTDFNAVTNAVKGTASFPQQVWATDVSGWAINLNAGNPLQATFVGYRLSLTSGEASSILVGGASLRN